MDQQCVGQALAAAPPLNVIPIQSFAARRRAVRALPHTPIEVGFVSTDGSFTAPLREFSPFGLSVGKPQPGVKIGRILRLAMRVDADCFRAAAIVRVCLPGGFAVEFLSMTPWDRELMHRLYRRLLRAVCEPPAVRSE
jgi:hypothetical protein